MKTALLLCAMLSLLGGCVAVRPLPDDEVRRLMARPDFPAVARTHPEWAADALRTVNRLQMERDLSR